MAFRDRLRKFPVFAAWSFAATAGACLALGLLAESSWLCDLLTHFRWQYAATLVTVNDLSYNLAAAHTSPPTGAANSEARNRQLQGIADELAGRPRTILCGDLNITPFSPWFASLLTRSGLTDPSRGSGFSPTWMRVLPPIAVPIDHILLSPDLTLVSRTVGPSLGSDHSPVIVELAANPPEVSQASRE